MLYTDYIDFSSDVINFRFLKLAKWLKFISEHFYQLTTTRLACATLDYLKKENMHQSLFYFLSIVSVVGIIGNLIVTYVYLKKGDKQTASFFILVLAFSDLIVCSILVPSTIYMEYIEFRTSSAIYCKLHYFITTTIVPSCCFLMTSIAFDRFFCICRVIRALENKFFCQVFAWFLSVLSKVFFQSRNDLNGEFFPVWNYYFYKRKSKVG